MPKYQSELKLLFSITIVLFVSQVMYTEND